MVWKKGNLEILPRFKEEIKKFEEEFKQFENEWNEDFKEDLPAYSFACGENKKGFSVTKTNLKGRRIRRRVLFKFVIQGGLVFLTIPILNGTEPIKNFESIELALSFASNYYKEKYGYTE